MKRIVSIHFLISFVFFVQLAFADTQADCKKFVDSLPANFTVGSVWVPENRSAPEKKIEVFYYSRIKKRADGSNAPAVVFFNGGPASDSHGSYEVLESVKRSQDFSFVYVDQRGTGCSTPYPTAITTETAERLTHYGSRNIVLDAEAIREKIFGQGSRWIAFGQSYGGYIVHRYAEVAPQSLLGAFAHGSSLLSDSVKWVELRILSQHRVAQDYFARYPDDRQTIQVIRNAIEPSQCFTDSTGGSSICGAAVLDASTILLGFTYTWPTLHEWLARLWNGSLDTDALRQFVDAYTFGYYADNAFASSIISGIEITPGLGSDSGCGEATARVEKMGEHPGDWEINECRLIAALKSKWDDLVNATTMTDPLTSSLVKASLTANPKLPFYLYSGQKDVFVPVETFEEETQTLGNLIHYTNFPESGHEGFMSEAQVWNDLEQIAGMGSSDNGSTFSYRFGRSRSWAPPSKEHL